MDTATALDHARSFYARIVKPFERLPEILEAAVTAETLVREAEARLASFAEQEHAARNRLQSLNLQIPLKEADVAEAQQRAATVLADLQRQMTEATQAAQEVIRAAEASAAAKLAQLDADHETREEALIATIEQLELRKLKLTEAIEAMQAQVASLTKG